MPHLGAVAWTLAKIHLFSYAIQAVCIVVWIVGALMWGRQSDSGPWLVAGGLGGIFACVMLRRVIVWWGRRQGWGDDAQPADATDEGPSGPTSEKVLIPPPREPG